MSNSIQPSPFNAKPPPPLAKKESQKPSILSRAALYAPLAAYDQTVVAPSDYLSSLDRLPKSIAEKALFSFLEKTSKEFHQLDLELHGKNTGARFLTEKDFQQRLGQKGLNLVGGGWWTSSGLNNDTNKSNNTCSSVSRTKTTTSYRNKRNTRNHKKRKRQTGGDSVEAASRYLTNSTVWNDQIDFLMALNHEWNDYACNILQIPAVSEDDDTSRTIRTVQERTLTSGMEWAGSRVRVDQTNKSDSSWIGTIGILIGDTGETWEVVPTTTTTTPKERTTTTCRVSKKDSILTVLLPLPTANRVREASSRVLCIELNERSKS